MQRVKGKSQVSAGHADVKLTECLAAAKRIFLSDSKYIGSSSKKSLGCSSGRQLVPRYASGDLHTADQMGAVQRAKGIVPAGSV